MLIAAALLSSYHVVIPITTSAQNRSVDCIHYIPSSTGPMDKAPAYGAGDSGFESPVEYTSVFHTM